MDTLYFNHNTRTFWYGNTNTHCFHLLSAKREVQRIKRRQDYNLDQLRRDIDMSNMPGHTYRSRGSSAPWE